MKSIMHPLTPEFQFAGFSFPKYVFTLPRGTLAQRIERAKNPCVGDYYHAPKPLTGKNPGQGFYLDSDGMPAMRWKWADDVARSIRHTGWYCDEFQDSKIRGLIMRLPNNRGFLAGWSMGKGMASTIDCDIYDDENDAALAADSMAERAAENERDYQAAESARIEAEELCEESERAEQDEG